MSRKTNKQRSENKASANILKLFETLLKRSLVEFLRKGGGFLFFTLVSSCDDTMRYVVNSAFLC